MDRTFWTATRIAGAATAVAGLVAAAAVLALREPGPASEAKLLTVAALVLFGVGAFAAPGDGEEGAPRALQIVLWMVVALVVTNIALAWVDLAHWVWRAPAYFPTIDPIGADFRVGGYDAALHFSDAASGWPPFTIVLSVPYLLLGANAAYAVHVCVLIALNVATLGLGTSILRSRDHDDQPLCGAAGAQAGILAPALAAWLFVSAGFLLSLERGNFDAFVAFLAMLGLWSMIKRPAGVWLPAIAFSAAAEIKVYPALLLALLIWRFRWRSVPPIIVCNVALALSAGPANLFRYLHAMKSSMANGADWVGNNSAKSFSAWVDQLHPRYLPHLPVTLLVAVPVALFILMAWRLGRRRDRSASALMLCGMVPLMCIVPSVSHDYKVVLFAGPALLLVGLLMRHLGRGSSEPWWMLLTLCLALLFIARVPGQLVDYTPNVERFIWPAVLMNKYPAVLLFQIVTVWMAWRLPAPAQLRATPDTPQSCAPGSGGG